MNPPKPIKTKQKAEIRLNCAQPGIKDSGTTIEFIDTFSSDTDGVVQLCAANLPNVAASCKGFETY